MSEEKTIKEIAQDYMQAGLVDQNPTYFKDGDVHVIAMAHECIQHLRREQIEVLFEQVYLWAKEMANWWNGLGMEYHGTTLEDFEAAQIRHEAREIEAQRNRSPYAKNMLHRDGVRFILPYASRETLLHNLYEREEQIAPKDFHARPGRQELWGREERLKLIHLPDHGSLLDMQKEDGDEPLDEERDEHEQPE